MNNSYLSELLQLQLKKIVSSTAELTEAEKEGVSVDWGVSSGVLSIAVPEPLAQNFLAVEESLVENFKGGVRELRLKIEGGSTLTCYRLENNNKNEAMETPLILHKDWLARLPNFTNEALEREVRQTAQGDTTAAIVRMGDGRQLFASDNIERTTGLKRSDWVGTIANTFFPPDELNRYISAIYSHSKTHPGGRTEIVFCSPSVDGQMFSRRVEAGLVAYNGELCRFARTIEMIPIAE